MTNDTRTLVTVLAVFAALALPASASAAAPLVLTGPTAGASSAVAGDGSAWTPARMRRAIANSAGSPAARRRRAQRRKRALRWRKGNPSPKLVTTDLPGTRTIGRLFSKKPDGTDWACSASLVESANRSVVWTAGHCVHSGRGGGPHSNFLFVPGYRPAAAGGPAPFGVWPATHWGTTTTWASEGDASHFRRDFGAVVLAKDALGRTLTDALGAAQRIAFPRKLPARAANFGYPALDPFNGESLYRCGPNWLGRFQQTLGSGPFPLAIACRQKPGSSGGPWLVSTDPATGIGTVVSVISAFAFNRPWMFGPVPDAATRTLFSQLSSVAN
jgi:hypothetical protein